MHKATQLIVWLTFHASLSSPEEMVSLFLTDIIYIADHFWFLKSYWKILIWFLLFCLQPDNQSPPDNSSVLPLQLSHNVLWLITVNGVLLALTEGNYSRWLKLEIFTGCVWILNQALRKSGKVSVKVKGHSAAPKTITESRELHSSLFQERLRLRCEDLWNLHQK